VASAVPQQEKGEDGDGDDDDDDDGGPDRGVLFTDAEMRGMLNGRYWRRFLSKGKPVPADEVGGGDEWMGRDGMGPP